MVMIGYLVSIKKVTAKNECTTALKSTTYSKGMFRSEDAGEMSKQQTLKPKSFPES